MPIALCSAGAILSELDVARSLCVERLSFAYSSLTGRWTRGHLYPFFCQPCYYPHSAFRAYVLEGRGARSERNGRLRCGQT
jgi:hypothetical protein